MGRKLAIGAAIILTFVLIFHESIYFQVARFYLRNAYPDWFEEYAPFRVIGNIHYVGSRGLAVYLLPGDDGHILIDGGVPEIPGIIKANIEKLGYKVEDIKILLNTHAHADHAGGLKALQDWSGAKLYASLGDKSALEGGFYLGSEDRDELGFPPIKVDHIFEDGEEITLGNTRLTARLTPGHTRGCTSWSLKVEEAGQTFDALIFCSTSVGINRLAGPPQYPGIVKDYQTTFARIKDWSPDIFLSNHAFFFDMEAKRAELDAGNALAFVKEGEFQTFLTKTIQDFEAELKQATKGE